MKHDRSTVARKWLETKVPMVNPHTGKEEIHTYDEWMIILHPHLKKISDKYQR